MMKKLLAAVLITGILAVYSSAGAQPLPMPWPSLGDIYYYLTEGIEPDIGGNLLEPPSDAVPGDSRFVSLQTIYEDMKALFEQCNATADDVRPGKKIFSVQTGSWGVQTGTYSE